MTINVTQETYLALDKTVTIETNQLHFLDVFLKNLENRLRKYNKIRKIFTILLTKFYTNYFYFEIFILNSLQRTRNKEKI